MGLFDRLKKKNNTEKERQQLEKKIQEKKEIINNIDIGLGDEFNKTLRKNINQSLDDAVIEKFGNEDEKQALHQRKEKDNEDKEYQDFLKAKINKGKRMHDINSIKIFREVINEAENYPRLVISSYHEMIETYIHIKQFDNALETLNECIEFKKQHNQEYSYETRKIDFINHLNQDSRLTQLQKEGESLSLTNPDEASVLLKEAIDLGSERYQTFKCLSDIYIREKDLNSAIDVLNIGIERIDDKLRLHNDKHEGLEDILENVNHKIEYGSFKYDCLPYDDPSNKDKIKEAKAILKEDKEKGIAMLEEIIANGTFNNTAYYTLYQAYNKDKRFDESIRICEKAIDDLGYFSNEKFEKWNAYLEKAIEKNS